MTTPEWLFLAGALIVMTMGGVIVWARRTIRRQRLELTRRLRERESQTRTIVATLPIPILISEVEGGRILFVNDEFGRAVGREVSELVGEDVVQFHTSPEERARLLSLLNDRGPIRGREIHTQRPDGTELWWSSFAALAELGGRPVVVSSYLDVTERRRQEAEVAELNRVLEARIQERTADLTQANHELATRIAAVEAASEAVVITDIQGVIEYVNPAFSEISGYSREEALGRSIAIVNSGVHEKAFFKQLWETILAGRSWHGEVINRRKNGSLYTEESSVSPILNERGEPVRFVAIKRDVTDRKRMEAQLEQLAHFDALTGLPNRSLFLDRLHQALAAARRRGHDLGLLYLDLDGFKTVNDTFGHETGDQLLKEAARRIGLVVRDSDTAARLGGDEFAILLTTLRSGEDAEAVAAKVVAHLAEPFNLPAGICRIGASVGIAHFPGQAETSDELLSNADTAMYRAKRQGKNSFAVYDATPGI